MQDNRGPRVRFFDDLVDLQHAAYIADVLINWNLDVARAIEVRGEEYTFIFRNDGLEALIFAVHDLYQRVCGLNECVDKNFRDGDGCLILDDERELSEKKGQSA